MTLSSSRSQAPAVTWLAKRFRACHRSPATRVEPSFWPRTARHSSCRQPSWPALPGGCATTFCSLAALRGGHMPPSTPTLWRLSVRTPILWSDWRGHVIVTYSELWSDLSVPSGMIRLPKATKTPQKSKLVPRQSLANIVKDLGKNLSNATERLALVFYSAIIMLLCLCSHLCTFETEGVQRSSDPHQQEPGQPASCWPRPAGKERVWQRQYYTHTSATMGEKETKVSHM